MQKEDQEQLKKETVSMQSLINAPLCNDILIKKTNNSTNCKNNDKEQK